MPEVERRIGQAESLQRIEDKLDDHGKKIDLTLNLLTGNGDPSKGVVLQLDRVREKMKLVWAGLIVAVGAACKAFFFMDN
jgi:hypothetical protein